MREIAPAIVRAENAAPEERVVRAAFAACEVIMAAGAAAPPDEFMAFPAGVNHIAATIDGEPWQGDVEVNAETASTLNRIVSAHRNAGRRPFFDFFHREEEASHWPDSFTFRDGPKPGVYVRGEWSSEGARQVLGKVIRFFSPSFLLDKYVTSAASPARIIGAPLCMGGLVNDPAFRAIAPVHAKNNMQPTSVAAPAIVPPASAPTPAPVPPPAPAPAAAPPPVVHAAQAQAAAESSAAQAAEITRLNGVIRANLERQADGVIQAARDRGILPAQAADGTPEAAEAARWRSLIVQDQENGTLLLSRPAAVAPGYITASHARPEIVGAAGGDLRVVSTDFKNVIRAMNGMNTHPGMHWTQTRDVSMERGRIFARELNPLFGSFRRPNHEGGLTVLREADKIVKAANSLGTLSGILVVQRCLEFLKYDFPMLPRVTTDFSAEPVKYNQAIYTRTRAVIAAGTYDTTLGYVSQFATDTDVSVTINNHIFTQITYTANDLASTVRLLFPEQEEGMHFGIGLSMINSLTALMLPANFPGAPAGFQGSPATNGKTVATLDAVNRGTLIGMKTALHQRGVIGGTRTCWLESSYHGALEQDVTIVGGITNPNADNSIREGTLPMVASFQPVEAPYLPANGVGLHGFAHRSDALVLAARLPNDYSSVFPGVTGGGVVETVTNPDTKLSVMVVMFLDHKLGMTSMRIAVMYGDAVGNGQSGQLLTSQ